MSILRNVLHALNPRKEDVFYDWEREKARIKDIRGLAKGLPLDEHYCRHQVVAITDKLDRQLAFVGWDGKLNTFFAQVGPPDKDVPTDIDPERMVFEVGTTPGEIETLEQLSRLLWNDAEVPWAELLREVGDHLEAYQKADLTRRFEEYQDYAIAFPAPGIDHFVIERGGEPPAFMSRRWMADKTQPVWTEEIANALLLPLECLARDLLEKAEVESSYLQADGIQIRRESEAADDFAAYWATLPEPEPDLPPLPSYLDPEEADYYAAMHEWQGYAKDDPHNAGVSFQQWAKHSYEPEEESKRSQRRKDSGMSL